MDGACWRILGAALALGLAATPSWADCTVGKIAELPVTMHRWQPITDAKINGTDVRFMIDSGSFFSVITPGSAKALGLRLDPMPGWRLNGINGAADMSVTTVKKFTLVGADLSNIQFIVAGSELGSVGVLGQNFLGLYDAEYDLPHGVVRLMRARGCEKANLAYWANGKPFSFLPIEQPDAHNPHTVGIVLVNGAKVKATFDTGASTTILSMTAAERAGITPSTPGVVEGGYIGGFGRKAIHTWIAPLDSFKVGDEEEIRHGRIRFGQIDGDAEMLLGADFFIAHRVYVANAVHRMFLTYEGGPVFDLSTEHRDTQGEKIVDAAPTETPTDAEGFSRAGAVKLTQNDREDALADFTKAIDMAPTEPRYLLQRASVYLSTGRRPLAVADVDKAISLKPDEVQARLVRAQLRMATDKADALADLDVAAGAAAPSADERLEMGGLYTELDRFDQGIAQLDQWIKSHPDDQRRPIALNDRCWAQALAGKDLPAALTSCNAAIHARPLPMFFDSRGLVELRMGSFAKAIQDYDVALKDRPNTGWSLYGRGIAKLRSGDQAGGNADLAAARTVAPKLADRAKVLGIAP